ncbi:hypothetical protein Q7C36_005182 [Tachysurus vachellii]|uniref:Uncharacterized protein n=1 Tax=Tachysurus vachellii TaxID=175792 RepID=A0AA88T3H1_TACVA|nr:hypothetical protein Q7C36_005182 [Tachysurus vachellii]
MINQHIVFTGIDKNLNQNQSFCCRFINPQTLELNMSLTQDCPPNFVKMRIKEPESSDSDWQPESKRPMRTPMTEEEELEPQPSTSIQPARQGRGRARGRAGGRSTPEQSSGPEGAWQGTDVEDITPDQPSFHPARTPGGQLMGGVQYTVLQLFTL